MGKVIKYVSVQNKVVCVDIYYKGNEYELTDSVMVSMECALGL